MPTRVFQLTLLHLRRGDLFSCLDLILRRDEEIIKSQDRYLRLLSFPPEVRLTNAAASHTSPAPSAVGRVATGLVLVDILLRRRAGVLEDALGLTLFAPSRFDDN